MYITAITIRDPHSEINVCGTVTQIYSTMTCTLDGVIVIKMGHGLELHHYNTFAMRAMYGSLQNLPQQSNAIPRNFRNIRRIFQVKFLY